MEVSAGSSNSTATPSVSLYAAQPLARRMSLALAFLFLGSSRFWMILFAPLFCPLFAFTGGSSYAQPTKKKKNATKKKTREGKKKQKKTAKAQTLAGGSRGGGAGEASAGFFRKAARAFIFQFFWW